MEKLIEVLVKSLVDKPEAVIIRATSGREVTIIEIQTDPSDTGKVIGKQGRIISAMRILTGAIGMKNKKRYNLEVLE